MPSCLKKSPDRDILSRRLPSAFPPLSLSSSKRELFPFVPAILEHPFPLLRLLKTDFLPLPLTVRSRIYNLFVFLFLDLRYPHCYQPKTYSDLTISTSPQERNSRPARPTRWLSFFLFASDSFRTGEKNEFKILAHLLTEKNLVRIFLFWADSLLLLCLISNLSLLVLFLLLPYPMANLCIRNPLPPRLA